MKNNKKNLRLDIVMLIMLFTFTVITVFVITPIRTVYGLQSTTPQWFTDILTTLSTTIFTLSMMTGFSLIAVTYFMNSAKKYRVFLVYIGNLIFMRLSLFATSYFTNMLLDELPEDPKKFAEFFSDEIYMSIEIFVWDLIFLLAAFIVIKIFYKVYEKKAVTSHEESLLLNDKAPEMKVTDLIHFKKLSTLSVCFLTLSLLFSANNITVRTIGLVLEHAEQNVFGIIGGYATDIFLSAIALIFACFLITVLYKMNQKKKEKAEDNASA